MRHGEGLDLQVLDAEGLFRKDPAKLSQRSASHGGTGAGGHIGWDLEPGREGGRATNMVTVFVGDDDGGQIGGFSPQARHSLDDLLLRETAIHEDCGRARFDQKGVPFTPAPQGGKPDHEQAPG